MSSSPHYRYFTTTSQQGSKHPPNFKTRLHPKQRKSPEKFKVKKKINKNATHPSPHPHPGFKTLPQKPLLHQPPDPSKATPRRRRLPLLRRRAQNLPRRRILRASRIGAQRDETRNGAPTQGRRDDERGAPGPSAEYRYLAGRRADGGRWDGGWGVVSSAAVERLGGRIFPDCAWVGDVAGA